MTQKVTPWLWFDTEAENAANDYVRQYVLDYRPRAKRPGLALRPAR